MFIRLLFILLFTIIIPLQANDSFKDDIHSVELISAYEVTGGLSAVQLGLHYKFQDEWKTYWKYAGTAGYPVKIDFSGSQNVKSVTINWPAPEEFVILDLKSYGYGKEVVLPLTIALEDPSKDTLVNLKLDYLVCAPGDCVQRIVTLEKKLSSTDPSGQEQTIQSNQYDLINSYINQVPKPDTGRGLTIDRVELDTTKPDRHVLNVFARNNAGFESPVLFIDPNSTFYLDFPKYEFTPGEQDLKITVDVYENELKKSAPKDSLVSAGINLVLKDGSSSVETNRLVEPFTFGWQQFAVIVVIAFIGGFILNFMPCVLPVIMIKVFSILQQKDVSRFQVRLNFLLTVAGILVSFLTIALLTILFRNLGFAVGWGTQFQEPVFLVAIMLVVLLFAYNLLGLFEINLSSKVSTKLAKIETRDSPLAFFFSGAFVTILATPCTAPFLGTALSFALSRGSIEIFSLFMVMGLGLALPFIALTVFPGIVNYFPKPGKWMSTFRALLSVLLFATLVWLLWTLSILHGTLIVFILAFVFALIGVILLLMHKGFKNAKWAWSIVLVLSVSSIVAPYIVPGQVSVKDYSATQWVKFDEQAINQYVSEGKIVFVDVTADWCLTCKANELFVIYTEEVQDLFKQEHIIAMQADWTHNDEKITSFLKRFNRYAIPFYVVFSPENPQGVILPEILTTQIVKDALFKQEPKTE